ARGRSADFIRRVMRGRRAPCSNRTTPPPRLRPSINMRSTRPTAAKASASSMSTTMAIPHTVDMDSGVGAQFTVTDLNGDAKPDIIVQNKRGLFYFLQR